MDPETLTTLARLFLGLNAAGIGLIGLIYLYDPNVLLARYELEAASAGMDNMLRGSYGGQFLGMAVVFAYGAAVPARAPEVLVFTFLFMGGFLLGRVVSIVRVGAPHRAVYGLVVFELVASVLSLALFGLVG